MLMLLICKKIIYVEANNKNKHRSVEETVMKMVRKYKLNKRETKELMAELDDYVWVMLDIHRGIIVAGDEFISEMRDELLRLRSRREDIYGVGLDLKTGEISYVNAINRRNPSTNKGELNFDECLRIETLLRYFFESAPCYDAERKSYRYSKFPVTV